MFCIKEKNHSGLGPPMVPAVQHCLHVKSGFQSGVGYAHLASCEEEPKQFVRAAQDFPQSYAHVCCAGQTTKSLNDKPHSYGGSLSLQ